MKQQHSDPRALVSLPSQGRADLLFVLLHGLGAQAAQMTALSDGLREQYPQAAVVCLTAPLAQPGDAGFSWFELAEGDGAEAVAQSVSVAMPAFLARLQAWAGHFELSWERVALAGFSQGATLALEAVQAQPALAGRVLAFAGGHATPPAHAPQDVSLHLLHGMADAVVPYPPIIAAARLLVRLGGDVTADIVPDVGHELHPLLIDKALAQLRTFVPGRLWREAMLAAPKE